MPPNPPSPINPSQAVERIREIIVGRHIEKLEQRMVRLETGSPVAGAVPQQWEDRLCHCEARLEAIQHTVQKVYDTTREDTEIRAVAQREEIQRLSAQIQQVAAMKAAESVQPAVQQLEHKIGSWLNNWQSALNHHLNDRESRMATQLRQEVASLWESTESQLTRLQSRTIDRDMIEERFRRIAAAALALAESASPPTGPEPAIS